MKLMACVILLISLNVYGQDIWINEMHYDNSGADENEFVEIAGKRSDSLYVFLYNGINGTPYDSVRLDTLTWFSEGMTDVSVWYCAGMQNGAPDGVVMVRGTTVLEALSYEGSFTGSEGVAAGMSFEELPVSEKGTAPPGYSLQRVGPGSRPDHFRWELQADASPGKINTAQQVTSTPVIVLEPSDTLNFGLVPFGNTSSSSAYLTYAVNVSSDLFIYVPEGFEASLYADFRTTHALGNPVRITSDGDFTRPAQIYVRFVPLEKDGRMYLRKLIHEAGATDDELILTGSEGNPYVPNAWINEFHYDNISFDTLEFVEISLQYPELYDSEEFTLTLYNGNNGQAYRTFSLDQASMGERTDEGFQLYVLDVSGIQNGPDGLCLSYRDQILHLVSYEGIFNVSDGPASGMTTTLIDPEETPETVINTSIQLVGSGYLSGDFEWMLFPGGHTMGFPNVNQLLPVILTSYQFRNGNEEGLYHASWETEYEQDNYGILVEASQNGTIYDSLTFVPGGGNSEKKQYYEIDLNIPSAYKYVAFTQIDFNGRTTRLFKIALQEYKKEVPPRITYELHNRKYRTYLYPGSLSNDLNIRIDLFSLNGALLRQLHESASSEAIELTHWLENLSPGIYLLKMESGLTKSTLRLYMR